MLLLLCHRHARISSTNSSSTDSLRKVWTLPVLASDEEFMRRVSIDLPGRPPDVDQLLAFLADQSSNKPEREGVPLQRMYSHKRNRRVAKTTMVQVRKQNSSKAAVISWM